MASVSITGAEPMIAEIENIDIAEGRYFSPSENENKARVAFIGMDVAKNLFPTGDVVGGEITIQGIPYRIIGVQTAKGTVFGQPQDNFVQLPIETFGANFGGLKYSRAPYFVAVPKNGVKMETAVDEARTLLRIKRKLPCGEKDNFGIFTPDAISGIRDSLFGTISIVILIVPGIALVVGAIVIMNIMLGRGHRAYQGDRNPKIAWGETGRHSSPIFVRVCVAFGSRRFDRFGLGDSNWLYHRNLCLFNADPVVGGGYRHRCFGRRRYSRGTFPGVEGGAARPDRGPEGGLT